MIHCCKTYLGTKHIQVRGRRMQCLPTSQNPGPTVASEKAHEGSKPIYGPTDSENSVTRRISFLAPLSIGGAY